jgi:hypothetical protein
MITLANFRTRERRMSGASQGATETPQHPQRWRLSCPSARDWSGLRRRNAAPAHYWLGQSYTTETLHFSFPEGQCCRSSCRPSSWPFEPSRCQRANLGAGLTTLTNEILDRAWRSVERLGSKELICCFGRRILLPLKVPPSRQLWRRRLVSSLDGAGICDFIFETQLQRFPLVQI